MRWPGITRTTSFNAAVSVAAFGLSPFFKKFALVEGVAPWTVALATACFAALASFAIMLTQRPDSMRQLIAAGYRSRLLMLGIVATGIVTLLVVQALTMTTATNRSLFQSAYPAATLLFAHLMLGERLRLVQYVAVGALVSGLLLMNGGGDTLRFGPGFWLLFATLPLIGMSDAYSKRLSRELSPVVLAGGRNIYGAVFLMLVTPLLGLASPGSWLQWVWLASAGLLQGVGVWTLYRALTCSKASIVAALVATAPLVTLLTEYLVIGLVLTWIQVCGLAVVTLAAVWLALSDGTKKQENDDGR